MACSCRHGWMFHPFSIGFYGNAETTVYSSFSLFFLEESVPWMPLREGYLQLLFEKSDTPRTENSGMKLGIFLSATDSSTISRFIPLPLDNSGSTLSLKCNSNWRRKLCVWLEIGFVPRYSILQPCIETSPKNLDPD